MVGREACWRLYTGIEHRKSQDRPSHHVICCMVPVCAAPSSSTSTSSSTFFAVKPQIQISSTHYRHLSFPHITTHTHTTESTQNGPHHRFE